MSKKGSLRRGADLKNELDPSVIDRALDECAARASSPKDRQWLRTLLESMVKNHAIPIELLEHIPVPPQEAGKTRFDQLYDAAMALVFPGYTETVLEKLLGPMPPQGLRGTRIWRALFPPRFGVESVLLRARTFQEAFAKACDWACRVSLRSRGQVPVDLTVRVMFMSERALRRYLDVKWANKNVLRRKKKLVGREVSARQMNGARICALGHKSDPQRTIAHYAERKDLRLARGAGWVRTSSVESESFGGRPAAVPSGKGAVRGPSKKAGPKTPLPTE